MPTKLAKKGLANFLGTAIGYLTGLTTENDLKNLQITMTKLILDSPTTTRYLSHQIKNLSSIFEVTNKRLDHAMSLIQEQNKIFQDFSSTVEKSLETLIEITQLIFQKSYSVNKLNAAITEYLHSLERLATGLLDPALITPDHLDKVLQDIEVYIQEAFLTP